MEFSRTWTPHIPSIEVAAVDWTQNIGKRRAVRIGTLWLADEPRLAWATERAAEKRDVIWGPQNWSEREMRGGVTRKLVACVVVDLRSRFVGNRIPKKLRRPIQVGVVRNELE
jgi:hypothetical protein